MKQVTAGAEACAQAQPSMMAQDLTSTGHCKASLDFAALESAGLTMLQVQVSRHASAVFSQGYRPTRPVVRMD